MYGSHLEHFVFRERWKYGRGCASEHGLTGTRWAIERDVMSACDRDLECAFCTFLSTDIREIYCAIHIRFGERE